MFLLTSAGGGMFSESTVEGSPCQASRQTSLRGITRSCRYGTSHTVLGPSHANSAFITLPSSMLSSVMLASAIRPCFGISYVAHPLVKQARANPIIGHASDRIFFTSYLDCTSLLPRFEHHQNENGASLLLLLFLSYPYIMQHSLPP